LNHPVESSGELRYDAPDRLEKTHAQTSSGNSGAQRRGAHRGTCAQPARVMDLHAYPQVQPFVESIRATLAGDRSAWSDYFIWISRQRCTLDLDLGALESKSKQSSPRCASTACEINFSRSKFAQPDGDRSLMTLRPSTLP